MPPFLRRLKALLWDTKIFENYSFMTAMNVVNGVVGFLFFPFVILVLGADSYGLYAFVLSICTYLALVVCFGLYKPSAKRVVENKDNPAYLSQLISNVLSLRLLLAVGLSFLFALLIVVVPFMQQNALIFALGFTQVFASVLNIAWYYRGLSRMRIVACVAVFIRLLSIPFIIAFVRTESDVWIFMLITSAANIAGSLFSLLWAIVRDGIRLRLASISQLREHFREGFPFFLQECTMSIKENGLPVLIGSFFQMRDVAIYDLAMKVVNVFLQIFDQVNSAIFPEYVCKSTKAFVRKLLRIEWIMSLSVVAFLAVVGYWIVLILGGEQMVASYPMLVLMSSFLVSGLVVSCYTNFVFIARNEYSYVAKNQLISIISIYAACAVGLLIWPNILVIGFATVFSVLCEVVYCHSVSRRIMKE